jgi:hypothetical protein
MYFLDMVCFDFLIFSLFRMDGQGLMKNFDSHQSPKGNEIVLFDSAQILPRYIIEFSEKDAKERCVQCCAPSDLSFPLCLSPFFSFFLFFFFFGRL